MNKILYWNNRPNLGYWSELRRDFEYETLKARITYDYNQGGLARFYIPVKEILGLNSLAEALQLFKDSKSIEVTVDQAFELAELFNKYSKTSMEYLSLEGTTVDDSNVDKLHQEYIFQKEEEQNKALAWYETLSDENKKHVDILSSRFIVTAG